MTEPGHLPSAAEEDHGAIVVPYENGPLLLGGDFSLRTPDGDVIDARRPVATVALCRCDKSAVKPFCVGTHKAINFRAGTCARAIVEGGDQRLGHQPA